MLVIFPILTSAQSTGKIAGKLVDEEGAPMIAANIIVLQTSFGAATDLDGNYEIVLPAGTYTVRAQYIGYKTETIEEVIVRAGATTSLDIQLNLDLLLSEEVVVVGYGVQKKRELTGAVTSVSMKSFNKIPSQNTLSALQGQATGVNIGSYDGSPSGNASVQIRGIGTINDNQPLYVIDGVPSEINYVDPGEIESIDILKDASSAAIYGSRAANGVIMITTKRGSKNSPLQVKFKTYGGIQSLAKTYDVMNTGQYSNYMYDMLTAAGETVPDWLSAMKANPGAYPATDWQDVYYKDAESVKYELSVSGGNDWMNFNVAGTYGNKRGIVIGTKQEKTGLRINSDFTKGKFKFGQSLAISRIIESPQQHQGWEGGYRVLTVPQFVPVYDNAMVGGYGMPDPSLYPGFPLMPNPLAVQEMGEEEETYDHIMASVYAEYEIVKGLKYKLQMSKNARHYHDYYFYHPFGVPGNVPDNSLFERRSRKDHTIIENTLTYDLSFDKHNIVALAGYSQEKDEYRNISGGVYRLPDDATNVIDLGTNNPYVNGSSWEDKLLSQFGRIIYDYDDTYLLTVNIRRDGSSRFNEDERYGVFPSASVGWRVSKESFFNIPEVNDLKLRASYGVLGNNQIDRYAYIASLYVNPGSSEFSYVFGDDQTVYTGAAIPKLAADAIKWETTKTLNIGFDLAMFNDMIGISAEYYVKNTEDMLLNIPLPWSAGVWEGPVANVGEMENKGFEFSASYRNYKSSFKYSFDLNLTTYSNKVVALSGIQGDAYLGGALEYGDTNPVTKTTVGQPIASFWLWQTAGLFQSDAEAAAYGLQDGAKGGDVKFVDTNNDGILNDDDRAFMGSSIPDMELGFNFNASWGAFDFNAFIFTSIGRKLFNGARWQMERMSEWENQSADVANSWTPENPNTDIPRAIFADPNQNSRPSDRFLENADYLRLKNIEIGYTLPKEALNLTGFERMRIFISAENLLTFTGYSGYDPAVGGGNVNDTFDRGVDRALYPFARTFLFGIDLSL